MAEDKVQEVKHCQNPFKICKNTDLELYIMRENKKLRVCKKCWAQLSRKEKW